VTRAEGQGRRRGERTGEEGEMEKVDWWDLAYIKNRGYGPFPCVLRSCRRSRPRILSEEATYPE